MGNRLPPFLEPTAAILSLDKFLLSFFFDLPILYCVRRVGGIQNGGTKKHASLLKKNTHYMWLQIYIYYVYIKKDYILFVN